MCLSFRPTRSKAETEQLSITSVVSYARFVVRCAPLLLSPSESSLSSRDGGIALVTQVMLIGSFLRRYRVSEPCRCLIAGRWVLKATQQLGWEPPRSSRPLIYLIAVAASSGLSPTLVAGGMTAHENYPSADTGHAMPGKPPTRLHVWFWARGRRMCGKSHQVESVGLCMCDTRPGTCQAGPCHPAFTH